MVWGQDLLSFPTINSLFQPETRTSHCLSVLGYPWISSRSFKNEMYKNTPSWSGMAGLVLVNLDIAFLLLFPIGFTLCPTSNDSMSPFSLLKLVLFCLTPCCRILKNVIVSCKACQFSRDKLPSLCYGGFHVPFSMWLQECSLAHWLWNQPMKPTSTVRGPGDTGQADRDRRIRNLEAFLPRFQILIEILEYVEWNEFLNLLAKISLKDPSPLVYVLRLNFQD